MIDVRTFAGGVPGARRIRRAQCSAPPGPHLDPFYRADREEFADLAPGSILRVREVEVAVAGLIPQRVGAWQILYRSSDLNGLPIAAASTIVLPWRAGPRSLRPILSYQSAIDAVAAEGFPSYSLRRGTRTFGGVPPWELLIIGSAVRRGWAVSIPDHEGLDGRWGAPREPGHIALDGVRAAMGCTPLGLTPENPVGLWGYSGGGLATAWAAEVAPTYAPELDIVGAALGSPVGNPASVFLRLNKTRFAGLPFMFVAGLCRVYPEIQALMDRHCTAEGTEVFTNLTRMTTLSATLAFAGRDLDDLLDIPLADLLAHPQMVRVLAGIQLGHAAPSAPVLVTQAVHDQLIAVEEIDELVDAYVEGGAHVTYLRDRLSEHVSMHPLAAPRTLDWLDDRFAGRPLDAPRTSTVCSVAASPRALLGLAGLARDVVHMLTGRPLRDVAAPQESAPGPTRGAELWRTAATRAG